MLNYLFFVISVLVNVALFSSEYRVIDLNVPTGLAFQFTMGESVVGSKMNLATHGVHAFVFSEKEGIIEIPNPESRHLSSIYVNDHGQIVGNYLENDLSRYVMFVFDSKNCTYEEFDPTKDERFFYEDMHAVAINNDGLILMRNQGLIEEAKTGLYNYHTGEFRKDFPKGACAIDDHGNILGETWLYSADKGVISMPASPVREYKELRNYGFNKAGTVFGAVIGNDGSHVGYLWNPETGYHFIDLTARGLISCVNGKNQFIGHIMDKNNRIFGHVSIFYDKGSGVINLDSLGGGRTWAGGLNDEGLVVGRSTSTSGETLAFIWDQKNGMRNLNDLIFNDSGKIHLEKAYQINEKGYIVCCGSFKGKATTFLLIPEKNSLGHQMGN